MSVRRTVSLPSLTLATMFMNEANPNLIPSGCCQIWAQKPSELAHSGGEEYGPDPREPNMQTLGFDYQGSEASESY